MDFGRLLRRSYEIVRSHPSLWVFGILLSLLGGGGGGSNAGTQVPSRNISPGTGQPGNLGLPPIQPERLVAIIIAVAIFIVALLLIFSLLRAIFEGGLIALADDADEGRPVSFGSGWRQGTAVMGRVWIIDFILSLPFIVIGIGVAAFILTTLLSTLRTQGGQLQPATIFSLVAVAIPSFFCLWFLTIVLSLISRIAKRIGILEDQSWSSSIGSAWSFITGNLGNTLLNWLIFGLIMMVLGFVLAIPLFGVFIGGIAALLANPHPSSSAIIGWIILMLIVLLIVLILNGIILSFHSTGWTLFVKWTLHPPIPAAPYPYPYQGYSGQQPPPGSGSQQ